MSKILLHTEIEAQSLLAGIARMQIKELEEFAREINAIITRKKLSDKEYQDKALLNKINQTVLSKNKKEQYLQLLQKLEQETISEEERQVFLKLTEEEEALRNERVSFMLELAHIRNVPFTQIMKNLGLTPIPHA